MIHRTKEELARASKESFPPCSKLGEWPEILVDKFRAVNGDPFHFMDHIKQTMHHSGRKPFFALLREAFFVYDQERLDHAIAVLKGKRGMTDGQIKSKMFYDFAFFRKRVPRTVPPPTIQYPRLRYVFSLCGDIEDESTGEPLFNASRWAKAEALLSECANGYMADHPDRNYYTQSLDKMGGR